MSSIHPRETLDRQINELFDEVLVMGSMVEGQSLTLLNPSKSAISNQHVEFIMVINESMRSVTKLKINV